MAVVAAAVLSSPRALEGVKYPRSTDDDHERLGSYVEEMKYLLAS